MNTIIREMLERNNKVLRDLHFCFGFDFESDFYISKHTGKFTLNTVLKEIAAANISDFNAVVLITDRKFCSVNRFEYAVVYGSGFGLSPKFGKYAPSLDRFCAVRVFEDARKDENKNFYIIAQNQERTKAPKAEKLDLAERYTYIRHIGLGVYNNPSKHGISSIDIKSRFSGSKLEYKPRDNFLSDNVNAFIDKSGYIIEAHKSDLKQAAHKLKTEKEKKKVDLISFDSEIEILENKLSLINEKIAVLSKSIKDFESAKPVYNILSYLRIDIMDFDRLRERNRNKSFQDEESARKLITKCNEEFNAILEM